MFNRNFNSMMTTQDSLIRLRISALTDARYLIADKSDFELIREWIDADPRVRREQVMAESYAVSMHGATEY